MESWSEISSFVENELVFSDWNPPISQISEDWNPTIGKENITVKSSKNSRERMNRAEQSENITSIGNKA